MPTPLTELADNYERLARELRAIADQAPSARVVRNDVGNLAIVTAGGSYLGWIDVLTGEVEVP